DIDSMVDVGAATSYEASYQNTGYFVQKFAPLKQWKSSGGGNVELNYLNNVIEIRLADTYLMEAEALIRGGGDAVKAAGYLNAVRARVGLGPVAATLDNIALERRKELATEGHRWFDLVRTGKAATALAFKGFTAGKNEILPIPLTELTNTKLVQNPNYN
ncbi:MAG: RagB/SusD family nutrient uptake outer membrane protein, partial [Sphingobacteriales bacterium]